MGGDGLIRRFRQAAFAPVDIASLVYFRIAYGLILLWEVWRYLKGGRIERYFLEPSFHFKFLGFGWVQNWPGDGLYYHFYAIGILAIFVAVGFLYRVSATLLFLAFSYVFLLEQALYLNHFYFIALVGFLMIWVPANRSASWDVRLRPSIQSDWAPAWALWILRAQMGVVYFFGGVAKLNSDWLKAAPLRDWLPDRADFPIIGPALTELWTAYAFSYTGLVIDLLAAPCLLWRPTRPYAFAVLATFHWMNDQLFSIGVFPWFALAMTALFFPADWPRQLVRWSRTRDSDPGPAPRGLSFSQTAGAWVLGAFFLVQCSFPLRHLLYPGNVSWTEEGHNFSWHMKLRDKEAAAEFIVTDPDRARIQRISPEEELTSWQYSEMAARPDLILQYAHHLAARARERGETRVQVRAAVLASLNGREEQFLIDPRADLALKSRTWIEPADWILPLEKELPPD